MSRKHSGMFKSHRALATTVSAALGFTALVTICLSQTGQGSPFKLPSSGQPTPTTDADKSKIAKEAVGKSATSTGAGPEQQKASGGMSSMTGANCIAPAAATGIKSMWGYTNVGANPENTACGQAAAATILVAWAKITKTNDNSPVRMLQQKYPADVAWGICGTSPGQFVKMMTAYKLKTYVTNGEAELKKYVGLGYPTAVVVDVGVGIPGWYDAKGNPIWGLHWPVVYAYDKSYVYLTNWPNNKRSWSDFRRAWNTWLTGAAGMSNKGMAPFS